MLQSANAAIVKEESGTARQYSIWSLWGEEMLDTIIDIIKFLFSLWKSLPEEHKDSLKKAAGEVFEPFFREQYRSQTGGTLE